MTKREQVIQMGHEFAYRMAAAGSEAPTAFAGLYDTGFTEGHAAGFAEGYASAVKSFYSDEQPNVICLPDESHMTVDDYEQDLRGAVAALGAE